MRYIKTTVAGLPDKKRSVFLVEDEGERPSKAGVWVEVYKIKDEDWTTDLTGKEIPLIIGWAKVEEGEKETKHNLPPLTEFGGMRLSPEVAKTFKKHQINKKGWVQESARHSLARKGIKTGQKKSGMIITPSYTKTTVKGEDPFTGETSDIEMFVPESVAKNISKEERERIIKKYQNKENWKNPPTIAVARTEEDARKIADVFTYYLGGAEITPTPAGEFRVTSKGYYYYIGA